MLTQGPTQDLKCTLNILSFLTASYSLDCLACAKDIMMIVLLLQMMWGWEGWGMVHLCKGLGGGDRGWVFFFYFLFCFWGVVNCSFMTGTL